jgi:hypothetical protein
MDLFRIRVKSSNFGKMPWQSSISSGFGDEGGGCHWFLPEHASKWGWDGNPLRTMLLLWKKNQWVTKRL